MLRITILADDLTGANAVAALLKHEGFQATVHLGPHTYPQEGNRDRESPHLVQVWNVGTRNIPRESVSDRLVDFIHLLNIPVYTGEDLVGLRIDSTLRGSIAKTIDFLLQRRTDVFALVVPAFPASGRTTENTIHFVDGVPVHETYVGHDPFSPVSSPDLRAVIGDPSGHTYDCLSIRDIRGGVAQVQDILTSIHGEGVRMVLCDAVTDDDIDTLARAATRFAAKHPAVSLCPVDPGPFTAALAKQLVSRLQGERLTIPSIISDANGAATSREGFVLPDSPVILGISASIMHNAKKQMDFLERDPYVHMYHYRGESADEVIRGLVQRCPKSKTTAETDWNRPFKSTIFLRTDTWQLPTEEANTVVQHLPQVVSRILGEYPSISGIYLSGGEAAASILTALGVTRLSLEEELAPLTTLSRPENGFLMGRWVVTKGGSIGDEVAVSRMAAKMMSTILRH
ncbi:four-carbon acid sugar kinase family protein [Alicyclobacillus dauci]|uniref:Four-carbon acid sugar kinase family protein n=1 Tax=Alicyclobacillus dauci TaxID=1475485 RepID=A0ABY6Z957_9BACL|nr:four-carbon acid sugar kinase family protein [Alicyclobacillus dauci]WAH36355.1 four-carbon acid sugar kinase family protein [Alicyclobacillus dauci]WAH39379.1 four-carbon acid sugar kinase family protein [Alicyclobacillus dauci]